MADDVARERTIEIEDILVSASIHASPRQTRPLAHNVDPRIRVHLSLTVTGCAGAREVEEVQGASRHSNASQVLVCNTNESFKGTITGAS